MNKKSIQGFISLKDLSQEQINSLINLSIQLKSEKKKGIFNKRLANKSVAMIFEKTSTRTRCAATVACFDEGAHAEFLGKDDIQMGKKESVRDTSRVLGRMFDAIIFRGYKQETVQLLQQYSGVPVINGLTDDEHPTQILADLMTIKEKFGKLKGIKITYLGDGRNNTSNTLLIACSKTGIHLSIATPKELFPEESLVAEAAKIAKDNGSIIELTDNPIQAVKNADVIYTDVWVSMGEETLAGIDSRIESLRKYQVNSELMKSTGKKDTVFFHCLPATHENEIHHMEVTEEVFESNQSLVFDQAENRLHTFKAILITLIKEGL